MSELLVVRLSCVVKLFCLRCVSCEMLKFSCRVLKSILEFDFSNSRSRILKSNFEFVFVVSLRYSLSRISIFDSNLPSKFSLSCSIRLLEFRCSIRFLEFRFSIRVSSSSSLNFSCRISNSNFSFCCSIRLLEIDRQIRLLEVRLLESSPLNFEFVLIYSTSRISIRNCRRNFDSKLSSKLSFASRILHLSSSSNFATFVARRLKSPTFVLNCHLTSSIILARSLPLRSRCHASFARAFRA